MICNIIDFGAKADGVTLNTVAIQRAVDECAKVGGYVYVPAGQYVTGTIELKSNVVMRFEPGAVLLASKYQRDFHGSERGCSWQVAATALKDGRYKKGVNEKNKPNPCQAVIMAENAENCGIEGPGEINGRRGGNYVGTENWENAGPAFLCTFVHCKNVFIKDVTFTNPGFFNVYTLSSTNVNIDSVKIFSRKTACGDGLDFDGSKNVTISNCFIDAGDDAIGLKTLTPSEPCENFTITNCVLSSVWAAVRIGPETGSDFRNINISNCVMDKCNDGFKIQLCEDRVFEDFTFSNITMINVMRPIFMTLNTYSFSLHQPSVRPALGKIRRIKFDNFSCRQIQKVEENGEGQLMGNFIYARQDGMIEDITLSNITFAADGGVNTEESWIKPELLADYVEKYPEVIRNMGNYPSAVLFARNVKNLTIKNCNFDCIKPDNRPAVVADNIQNFRFIESISNNTEGLLKTIACENMIERDNIGKILGATKEEEELREKYLKENGALLDKYREIAEIADRAIGLPLQGQYSYSDEKITLDLPDNEKYLVIPTVHTNFKVIINGKEAGVCDYAEEQATVTCYALEITKSANSGKNTIEFAPLAKKQSGKMEKIDFSIFA